MNIIQRAQAPTPKFFQKVRTGGLIMASLGAAILSVPITLPPGLIKLAGYLTIAGGVASAVSQVATSNVEPTSTEQHGA